MKPTPLHPLRPSRLLFARHLSLSRLLRRVAGWSGWVSVIGTAGFIAIAGMAAHGCTGN